MNKRKIRVLHVLKSSIYSGAESVVITVMKQMADRYEMAYLATDGEIRSVLERENIPHYLLQSYSRRNVCKVIKQFRPDIVHAHDFTASVICASIQGDFHLISHLHHNPDWERRWGIKSMLYNICAPHFEKILTVSQLAYHDAVFERKLCSKIQVLENPVDIPKICQLGEQQNQSPIYDVLYVGRFVQDKNPLAFVEIVRKLRECEPQIKCAMLGAGELLDICKKRAQECGLECSLDFLGFQKNPYQYMKKARLLCITSEREGYGLVAAEANILGTPAISTRNGGVVELFGEDAIEICDNLTEFPNVICRVLNDAEEYQIWRQRAVQRQERFVSVEDYENQLNQIYEGCQNE